MATWSTKSSHNNSCGPSRRSIANRSGGRSSALGHRECPTGNSHQTTGPAEKIRCSHKIRQCVVHARTICDRRADCFNKCERILGRFITCSGFYDRPDRGTAQSRRGGRSAIHATDLLRWQVECGLGVRFHMTTDVTIAKAGLEHFVTKFNPKDY